MWLFARFVVANLVRAFVGLLGCSQTGTRTAAGSSPPVEERFVVLQGHEQESAQVCSPHICQDTTPWAQGTHLFHPYPWSLVQGLPRARWQ